MAYKRILTIQDISCLGQCSMTVALPILSACGHETCILPTAILSTHTGGFGKPQVWHLSDMIHGVQQHWLDNNIVFDAIYVGYLGSVEAVEAVSQLADVMLAPGGRLIVDPAMADHGKLYSGFDAIYAGAMQKLCEKADIMIPNITEAAMMAGLPYYDNFEEDYIRALLENLQGREVVLTGVAFDPEQTGMAIRSGKNISYCYHPRIPNSYHGTGDIFASAFTGIFMQGKSMEEAVKLAGEFTLRCIRNTFENPAHWYGVKFETALPWLVKVLFE